MWKGQTAVISFGCLCSRSLALEASSPVLQQEMFLPMSDPIEQPPSFAVIVACAGGCCWPWHKWCREPLHLVPHSAVAMMDEICQKLPGGLAEQWCTMESSARTMHLTVNYAIFTLGTWLCRNVWSSSSCLSWHGILLVIQLTVPSMLSR